MRESDPRPTTPPTDRAALDLLLERMREGDTEVQDEFFRAAYDALHALAQVKMMDQPKSHTLRATGLVSEVCMRLMSAPMTFENERHFLAVAATSMRQILVDHARRKRAQKRDGGGQRLMLEAVSTAIEDRKIDILALDEGLQRLRGVDAVAAQMFELHFFSGLSVEECAPLLDVSVRQAYRLRRFGRAYLHTLFQDGEAETA